MDDLTKHRTKRVNEAINTHVYKLKEEIRQFKENNNDGQRSDEKYKLVAKVASIGVWDWNMKLNVMIWDDKMYEIYGVPSQDFMPYESWTAHVHPDDLPAVEDSIKRTLENQTRDSSEFRIIRSDGKIRYISASAGLVRDKNNNITRVVGVNSDITERKMAEKSLMNSEQELRMANASKDKLFSIVAHDLISPFHSVLGFSKLLMLSSKEKDYEKVEKYATSINIAANHTFHLLSNLLDWSRSQRNKILFQPEVLNMKEISRQIIVLYSYMIDEKQIFVETRIDSAVTLYADSNMVQTIMRNLVSNAIKFSGEEDTIHISASQKEREVEICVADTGKGILGEDLEKIFHPGLSVSTNGSHDEKGSGLGLIICKDFVERHGGKIWIESKENIGTKVYFTIPENLKTAK